MFQCNVVASDGLIAMSIRARKVVTYICLAAFAAVFVPGYGLHGIVSDATSGPRHQRIAASQCKCDTTSPTPRDHSFVHNDLFLCQTFHSAHECAICRFLAQSKFSVDVYPDDFTHQVVAQVPPVFAVEPRRLSELDPYAPRAPPLALA